MIAQLQAENKRAKIEVGELQVKLRIPRHHFKYLEEHGVLEEFVKAKMDGDDQAAKRALDKAIKKKASSVNDQASTDIEPATPMMPIPTPSIIIPH